MREIIFNKQEIREKSFIDPKLVNYVAQCRKMRIADEEIRKKLTRIGWPEKDVDRILGETKTEPSISFLGPSVESSSFEKINSKEVGEKGEKKEYLRKEKKSRFFSKKTILTMLAVILTLSVVSIAGYYFLLRKTESKSQASSAADGKEIVDTNCAFNGLPKPDNSGSAVIRVDSTMKLLMKAIAEENYCLALSLYTDDSRDKYKDLIKNVIELESKRNKLLIDLAGYMIPAMDENNPSAEAKAVITSNGADGNAAFDIRFSKNEFGAYLISSM